MKPSLFLSACLCVLPVSSALAAHGLALGGTPRYAAGFTHFDYVNPQAPKGGSLTLPAAGGFDSLNPFTLKGNPAAGLELTYDTLTEQSQDEPFAMYGLLAQDIALAADGLSVTFTLNPRARFHNGDPVLAKDVAYSFRTLTQDAAASPLYRFYWVDVAAVETPDARRVRFRFKKPNAELHMILGQLPVFSHKSFPQGLDKASNRAPIGSGPYRLAKADYNQSAEYRRDPAYWAQNLPVRRGMYNFDTVRFRYYKDAAVRVEGIKAGRYDFAQETTARDWARAYPESVLQRRNLIKQSLAHSGTAGLQGFVMNQRRSLFADVRVRRALTLSFDFESLNSRMFYQSYRRSDSFFTNSTLAARGLPDADESALLQPLKPLLPADVFRLPAPLPPQSDPKLGIRPNLLAARKLLEEAGYRYRQGRLISPQGTPVTIEFLTTGKTFERLVAKWQRDLAKIGITLNVRVTDPAVYQKRLNDFDFDITTVVYANSESPGNEQSNYFSCASAKTPGSRNWAGVCHPAVEKLLTRFEHFDNRRELTAAARSLDRVLRHQYIAIPNWYSPNYNVIYRADLRRPAKLPLYYQPQSWALQTWWKDGKAIDSTNKK